LCSQETIRLRLVPNDAASAIIDHPNTSSGCWVIKVAANDPRALVDRAKIDDPNIDRIVGGGQTF
jgi:hypothetical protein